MIYVLFSLSTFLIGYSLNPSVAFKEGIEALSVGLALFGVYVAHLLSKNRERVREYENVYFLMNGICTIAKKIADIVEVSKKEYKKGEFISAPLQSIEIINVCSEELLKTYKKEVDGLEARRLFDSESVLAIMSFKLHFDLFVQYVLAYMDFNHKMDPEIRRYIEQYYQAYLSEMKLNRSDMAYKALSHHDEMLIIYFNGHCNSILTQYKLLEKHKQQVMLGLKKIKRKLFF